MQRRHFEGIARAIAKAQADLDVENVDGELVVSVIEDMANEIADLCAKENPLFKRHMFLAACGV